MDRFPYFSIKPYVVGTHLNCLGKVIPMRTHNLSFLSFNEEL